jgi:hypothetical protein
MFDHVVCTSKGAVYATVLQHHLEIANVSMTYEQLVLTQHWLKHIASLGTLMLRKPTGLQRPYEVEVKRQVHGHMCIMCLWKG